MKVKVMRDACIGCGACQVIAEKVFELDDEGISKAIETEVRSSDVDDAREAVESCPTGAISIEE